MTQQIMREQGQCLCGAVRFETQVGAHEIGIYSSSTWGERCFCSSCGSMLAWRSKDGGHHAVAVQAFANPSNFRFVSQIFIDEKPDCYSFTEPTKNMTGAELIAMVTSAESKA